MKLLIKIIAFIISLSSMNLLAQDISSLGQNSANVKLTGQSSMTFLQIGVSPRAAALGGAYTAMSQGVESVFFNPAGLTEMNSQFQAFVSSTQWFADIKYLAGAIGYNSGDYGAFALSFIYVDYGTIKGTSLVPAASTGANYTLTGDVKNVGAYSFGLTYVKAVSTKFAIGGTVKYVGQQLGQLTDANGNTSDNNANKLAFDMGIKYFPGIESLRLGMSIRNFSTFVQYQNFESPLPLAFSVGLGMNLMDLINKDMSKEHALVLSSEFVHPNDYTDRVNTGLEYTFMNLVSLRAGYETNHDILSWSGGVGLGTSLGGTRIDVDYSYSHTKYFDGVNRFALKVGF
ncbi:MAG: PorV/PorQ family protein [Ignavibacteriaceae bacterium]|jgi:hypothetical protein